MPPREKGQDLTTRRVFLRLAAPPRTHGPSFPGAWAGGPLSRIATSPLRRASRHPFAVHVFQQVGFPRGLVLTGVRRPLGSRTRFRALCLTPRFFEPRCRQTNSAISLSTHGHTQSNGYPRPRRRVSSRFTPTSVTRRGWYEPRNSSWGCTPTLAYRSPSSRGHAPKGNGDEYAWVGRPERRTYRSRFPSSSTSRASGSPSRFEAGHGLPTSCTETALDPRLAMSREGHNCQWDRDAFHCSRILAWSGEDPRVRLDYPAVTPPALYERTLPRREAPLLLRRSA